MPSRKDRAQALAARSRFWIDDLHVQPDKCVVMRGEEEIKLEQRMMEVLVELAENGKKPVSTDALLKEFWSDDNGNELYDENPVTKSISALRKKIGDDARSPRYIRTVSKQGYCIIPKVKFAEGYRHVHRESGTWTRGNPYVGLKSFDHGHADVFQGRSATVADLMQAMRDQIDNERRFVLIVGPSGCGKTSLVHASMIPTVAENAGFNGLHALSVATCDLGTASDGDLMTILAASLAAWRLGDHDFFSLHPQEHLREMLIEAPEKVSAVIEEGFRRYPVRGIGEQPYAHLLLAIDHAESLIAARDVSPEQRSCFARAVRALCDTPRTLTTMIARLDFYPALADALPELADYRSGHGHFEVSIPSEGELAKIIRKPAALAGVDFEEHPKTQVFLDDLLCKEAIAQPDALPLLQHTLHALYERCGKTGLLTYAAYEEIGGLEGAIARRAEEVFGGLPLTAEGDKNRILGLILARLVVIQSDSGAVSASPIVRSRLDSEANQMVQAFIDAHLFVSDLDAGQPIVKVAHEALLRQWPRAADWIDENRRLLQARGRLRRAADRWEEDKKSADHLLNSGRPLSEAEEAKNEFSDDLNDNEREFLRASQHLHYRKRWIRRAALSTLASLTVAMTIMAALAVQLKIEADANRRKAIDLIGYNLVDLADELRPTGSIQSLDNISKHALGLLKTQPPSAMDTDELINYSRALRIRGEVLHAKRLDREALKMFRRADEIAKLSVDVSGHSAKAVFETGQTAYWLGETAGNDNEARKQRLRYLEISNELLKIEGETPRAVMEKSFALNTIGAMHRDAGLCDKATSLFVASASLKEAAISADARKTAWRYELQVTDSNISRCMASQGQIKMANERYAKNIDSLRQLIAKRPDAIDWYQQLSSLLHFNAMTALDLGKIVVADKKITESIELLTILTKLQPENIDWKRALANSLIKGSEIAMYADQLEVSERRISEASRLISERKGTLPDNWLRIDAIARFRMSILHKNKIDMFAMNRAIEDMRSLAAREKKASYGTASYADALIERGVLLSESGAMLEAQRDWKAAASVLSKSAITSDPMILSPWIRSNRLLGQDRTISDQLEKILEMDYRHPSFMATYR